ncbi:MAG: hypothetical protein JXB88_22375 [Spirochaetales bacterium]|nr:hypothetical protein [Spirochaetales bacterium]
MPKINIFIAKKTGSGNRTQENKKLDKDFDFSYYGDIIELSGGIYMRKANTYLIIIIMMLFFFGCQACPRPKNMYHQGENPAHNTIEDTGMILDSSWQAIQGEITPDKEAVSYKVALLPQDKNIDGISLAVCYNNKKLTPSTGELFPLEIIAFNEDDQDKPYRNRAGEDRLLFDYSNISYLLFSVYTLPDYTSGKYEICFKK